MKIHAEPKTRTPSRDRAAPVPNTLAHQAQLRQALHRAGVQPRLEIGAVNDPLEREADAAAERVMRMTELTASGAGGEGNLVQRSAASTTTPASPQLESSLNSLNSGGKPLEPSTRAFFEPRFGQDFSRVRLHTDDNAAEMADSLNAKAFTLGNDIAFAANTPASRNLLGHELAHVVQQRGLGSGAVRGKSIQRQSKKEPQKEKKVLVIRIVNSFDSPLGIKGYDQDAQKALSEAVATELGPIIAPNEVRVEMGKSSITSDGGSREIVVHLVEPTISTNAITEILKKSGIEPTEETLSRIVGNLSGEKGQYAGYSSKRGAIFVPIGSIFRSLGELGLFEGPEGIAKARKTMGVAISRMVLHEIGHDFGLEHTTDKNKKSVISNPQHIMDFKLNLSTETTIKDLKAMTFTPEEIEKLRKNMDQYLRSGK